MRPKVKNELSLIISRRVRGEHLFEISRLCLIVGVKGQRHLRVSRWQRPLLWVRTVVLLVFSTKTPPKRPNFSSRQYERLQQLVGAFSF